MLILYRKLYHILWHKETSPDILDKEITTLSRHLEKTGLFKNMQHAFFQLSHLHADSRFADNNNEIKLYDYSFRILPDDFLHKPAHPVTNDGIAYFFAGRNTKPEWIRFVLARPVNDKLAVGERFAVSVNPAEIFAVS